MALSEIYTDFVAELTGGQTSMQKKMPGVKGGFAPAVGIGGAWRSLGTTGKVLVGAGVGGAVVGTYNWLFGGKKAAAPQTQTQAFAPQTPSNITNTNTTTNTTTYTSNTTGDWSTNIISNSPYSSLKKGNISGSATPAVSVAPQVSVIPTSTASQRGEQAQAQGGTDWATLAAIAGVALVAYGYTSRKGHK